MNRSKSILEFRVVVAQEGQVSNALDIRRRVYCPIGKLEPSSVQDEFDDRATHFIGANGNKWVSSARMVADGGFFEMERYFDLSHFRRKGRCAEINRLAILPEYRCSTVAYGMFRGFYRYALANNIRYFCIVATPGFNSRMYLHLGFIQIGDTVVYKELNELHNAYILDLKKGIDELRVKNPKIHECFLQPIDGIG